MSVPVPVSLPSSREDLAGLAVGDSVLLTGDVYAARDATHARIVAEAAASGALPYGLAGEVLFYAGPTPPAAGRPAGAIGPTTASRMDAWTPGLLRSGIIATIGKGARSAEVVRACAETGSVYFAAVGGTAALLATHVTEIEPVAYEDLGPEALVRVRLVALPLFVAIDANGNDLYERIVRGGAEEAMA